MGTRAWSGTVRGDRVWVRTTGTGWHTCPWCTKLLSGSSCRKTSAIPGVPIPRTQGPWSALLGPAVPLSEPEAGMGLSMCPRKAGHRVPSGWTEEGTRVSGGLWQLGVL